jgi:hypothetical protein
MAVARIDVIALEPVVEAQRFGFTRSKREAP